MTTGPGPGSSTAGQRQPPGPGEPSGPGQPPGPRQPPARVDGFAPIADYAAIGDGRTVALLASDGRLDWWPFPTLDSPPVCAAMLDPASGGHFRLAPAGDYRVARRYVEGTNVLEMSYVTGAGRARVTAALNTGSAGRLPWTELAFRVEGDEGRVLFDWEFVPGNRFGRASPWVRHHGTTPVITIDDQTMAVVVDGAPAPTAGAHRLSGTVVVGAGERAILAVVATDEEPLFVPPASEADDRVDRSIESWRRWSDLLTLEGRWAPAVRRSALALKTLLTEETGSIAAAATTSLPEGIGGNKNWDYRYSWVRDSSFTLDALINLGLDEEVHGAVSWLLDAIKRNGRELHVFYALNGDVPEAKAELDIPGYRGSQPVRSGNSASGQTQLGTYGDLFDTLHRYCQEGHLLDPQTGRLLVTLADRCCDHWRNKDSGIWELPRLEHYTISKMGCWVALDRAADLAEKGQLATNHVDRWRIEAAEIKEWVHQHCWSDAKRAYTFYAGTDDLDAAVLLAGRTGFDRGERLASTVEAVIADLGRGPLLYRYTGMEKEEGAFLACSFWMVNALVHTGQHDRAARLMDELVALTNDVGLLSEQIDPETKEFLGNTPQGLSHLALINAAFSLERPS